MWTLRKRFTFSQRNKFKFQVKWYIMAPCSQSGWNTHSWFEFWGLHCKLSGMFKVGTIVIRFQSRCWFDLLFTIATGRKKDRKILSNDAILSSDSQIGGSNKQPKKAYIQKTWANCRLYKQKDELTQSIQTTIPPYQPEGQRDWAVARYCSNIYFCF